MTKPQFDKLMDEAYNSGEEVVRLCDAFSGYHMINRWKKANNIRCYGKNEAGYYWVWFIGRSITREIKRARKANTTDKARV